MVLRAACSNQKLDDDDENMNLFSELIYVMEGSDFEWRIDKRSH